MARVYVERRELPDDLRRLLDAGAAAVEYTPPIDVIETDVGDRDPARSARASIAKRVDDRLFAQRPADRRREDAGACRPGRRRVSHRRACVRPFRARDRRRRSLRRRPRQRRRSTHGELRVVLPRVDERRGAEDPHPGPLAACASCSSATSSASRGARSRAAPSPRSSSASRSTSSSPTSRTPPPASASPATSPTRSSATASTR